MQDQSNMGLILGQEDALEKEIATHSSILALRNLMEGGAWRVQSVVGW